MFDRLEGLVAEAKVVLADLDPNELVGAQPARALELVIDIERRAAACRSKLAARVAEGGGWRYKGHRSVAHWLADVAGTSVGAAKNSLDTAERLNDLPVVQDAFEAGQLSEAQAKEVSKAAKADPASQSELVRTAERKTLRQLKKKCGRVIAAADPSEAATYERIHRARSPSWDTDSDGTWRLLANTPERPQWNPESYKQIVEGA